MKFPPSGSFLTRATEGLIKTPCRSPGTGLTGYRADIFLFFKEGASRGNLHEREIVYNIAVKAEAYLRLLAPGGDWTKFYQLLTRYSDAEPRRIYIETSLSRGKSITEEEADRVEDPNGAYRLFDYPDRYGNIQRGRLSLINAVKPHLVVSLHLGESAPRDYEGMNPVIIPSYDFLKQGLLYLKKNNFK